MIELQGITAQIQQTQTETNAQLTLLTDQIRRLTNPLPPPPLPTRPATPYRRPTPYPIPSTSQRVQRSPTRSTSRSTSRSQEGLPPPIQRTAGPIRSSQRRVAPTAHTYDNVILVHHQYQGQAEIHTFISPATTVKIYSRPEDNSVRRIDVREYLPSTRRQTPRENEL